MHDNYKDYSIDSAPEHPKPPERQYCVLAEARIADQPFENIFSPDEALKKGTLFADLVRPYKGKGVRFK